MIIYIIAITTISVAFFTIPELFTFNEDLTWDKDYVYIPKEKNKNKKVTFNNKVTVYKYKG